MMKFKILKAVAAICVIAVLTVSFFACSDTSDKDPAVSIWSESGRIPYGYSLAKYIVLGEYNEVNVERIDFTYNSDVRISYDIASLFSEYSTYKETDRAFSGAMLTVNCTSYCDGAPSPIFNAEGVKIVIDGATSFDSIGDPYVARLAGASAEFALSSYDGSAHVTEATFVCPEYFDKYGCGGKTVTIKLEVVSVKELHISEIPENTVSETTGYSSLSSLRSALSAEYEESDNALILDAYKDILWHRVQKDATVISLPKEELERCINEYVDHYKELAAFNGCSYEEYLSREGIKGSDISAEAKEYADEKVRNELVAFAIAQDEELIMSKPEFEEMALKLAEASGYSGYRELIEYNREEQVYVYLTWQKVIDHIVSHAQLD